MAISNKKREKIVELIKSGMSSGDIAHKLGVGQMQVAGIKAHLTMKERGKEKLYSSETADSIPLLWLNTPPPKGLTPGTEETSILIGTDQIFGGRVSWNFGPKTGSVNPHILIIGETGFGKTYAAQCIVAELQQRRIASIIFDYGQAFSSEGTSREFILLTKPTKIEVSQHGAAINPLRIFPHDMMGPINVAQRTADSFCRIYPHMGIQQKEAIIEAIERAFLSANISTSDKSSWVKRPPEFSQVHKMLKDIAESRDHPLRSHARTAYSHVRSFFRFGLIRDKGVQITWDDMMHNGGNVWIINLRGLDDYVSMILTEMLLWNLISYLQSVGPSDLKLFVVLDEAHKLSFEKRTPADWMLREGRKFGLGVILASQQLEDYSTLAVANTATKLVFQNHDERYVLSRALVKKCKNINDYKKISQVITTLERGIAFFLTENTGRLLRIDRIEGRVKQNG